MSLLGLVVRELERLEAAHALIGAAAMAFHGASRATLDIDLLTVERKVLDGSVWATLEAERVEVDVRRGDAEDPLAGVVRLTARGERSVDLLVGRAAWQNGVIARAVPGSYSSVELAIVAPADLVLLKLYAGGPQDAWDIRQLMAGMAEEERAALVEAVEAVLGELGEESRALWRRIIDEG